MTVKDVVLELKTAFPTAVIDEKVLWEQESITVENNLLIPVLTFLKNDPKAGFTVLMDLTGVDYLEPRKQTKVVYLLHNPDNYTRLRVYVYVLRGGLLPSVTKLWEGADWYERELFDLFGIHFEGHPDMKRILMPDDWLGHPLLRDYALTEEPVEFKHGVKPKVPSQIIPYVQYNER